MPSTTTSGGAGGGGSKRSRSFGGGMSSNSANQNSSNSGHQLGIRIGKQPTAGRSLSLTAARRQRSSTSGGGRAASSSRASTSGNRPSSAGSASVSSSAGNGGFGSSAGLRRKRPGSSSNSGRGAAAADDDPQTRLESLTLHLSSLEAQRDAKRTRLQALGDQMQKIRSRMKTLEEELQGLDGDIDDVEGQVRRLARSAGAGQGGGVGGGGGGRSDADACIDSQTQTLQYASTQLSPTQAEAETQQSEVHENLDGGDHQQDTRKSAAAAVRGNGYVGSMQDVGTQDMDDDDEEEDNDTRTAATATTTAAAGLATPQGYGRTLAPPDEMLTDPPASSPGGGKFGRASTSRSNALTMNPDEVLTEPVPPTQGEPISHTGGMHVSTSAAAGRSAPQQNDHEMDMIANHYDDLEEEEEEEGEGMHGMPPPEDDFDYQHNGAGGESASAFGAGGYAAAAAGASGTSVDNAFESITRPSTTNDFFHTFGADARPGRSDSDVIELGTVYHADPPAAMVPSGDGSNRGGGTLDSYFARSGNDSLAGGRQQEAAARRDAAADGGVLAHATSATAFDAPPPRAASFASSHSNRPTREDRNASYMHRLARDDFPWSREMDHHLRHTFRIQSFRENQKEVINATMSGDDVMVLMRTGGGKSEFLLTFENAK